MESASALHRFAVDLQQEVLLAAETEGDESLRSQAFTELMISNLIEAGEIDDGAACYYRARGVEVSGYGFGHGGETLDLFVTIYRGVIPSESVSRSDVETSFNRLANFLDRSVDGLHRSLEEASPVFDMALSIHEAWETIDRVRFFLLTDGIVRSELALDRKNAAVASVYNVWDLQRIYRYSTSGQRHEPIRIDFVEEFGRAIPCLVAPGGGDYRAYLAILPGEVLDGIYSRYGPRLLELNVRSFLQVRGKVNQGIRKTILEQPARFFAYNNGISATARAIEMVELPEGGCGITTVDDLQIVNGGQTTASIHSAVRKDKADISEVFVQAKLTVIGDERLEAIVPLISRFANSQNKIDEADFSANDPFHVRMEELSRTVWAPPRDGTQRLTKWFYERARGQYQDALGRAGTPGKRREFSSIFPTAQRFTKTDLAKFENTWDQHPHLVSLGAQKNFHEFALRLAERGKFEPDQVFYQRHIARAIIFRRAEKLIGAQKFGGYRANIVTYTLAYLSHVTKSRIDLDAIWTRQDISSALANAITDVSSAVHVVITNPPGGRNVTEWCKKIACWERVRALDVPLSASFLSELIFLAYDDSTPPAAGGIAQETVDELDEINRASRVEPEVWFGISNWAKETGHLLPWQRSLAYSLGRVGNQGRRPSIKQARQGLRLLAEAERLGYQPAATLIVAGEDRQQSQSEHGAQTFDE